MLYNSQADVVRLLAERYYTKSNVKLGGFRFQLPMKSCDTKSSLCMDGNTYNVEVFIYTYIGKSALFIKKRLFDISDKAHIYKSVLI